MGSLSFSFSGCCFSGVCLEWGCNKIRCFVINIYAAYNLADKRRMWDELRMSKRGFGNRLWCLVGNFNAVLSLSERIGQGGRSSIQECAVFRDFVGDFELVDVPLLGKKFTWYRSDSSSMSRLDRFLLSKD